MQSAIIWWINAIFTCHAMVILDLCSACCTLTLRFAQCNSRANVAFHQALYTWKQMHYTHVECRPGDTAMVDQTLSLDTSAAPATVVMHPGVLAIPWSSNHCQQHVYYYCSTLPHACGFAADLITVLVVLHTLTCTIELIQISSFIKQHNIILGHHEPPQSTHRHRYWHGGTMAAMRCRTSATILA